MARLGVAIDIADEGVGLSGPLSLDSALAMLISPNLGNDVLVCKSDPLGATYEAVARDMGYPYKPVLEAVGPKKG